MLPDSSLPLQAMAASSTQAGSDSPLAQAVRQVNLHLASANRHRGNADSFAHEAINRAYSVCVLIDSLAGKAWSIRGRGGQEALAPGPAGVAALKSVLAPRKAAAAAPSASKKKRAAEAPASAQKQEERADGPSAKKARRMEEAPAAATPKIKAKGEGKGGRAPPASAGRVGKVEVRGQKPGRKSL